MKEKDYIKISGAIFGLVAVFHVWRLLTGMQVSFGGVDIPVWVSGVGFVIAGFLCYSAWTLKK